MTLTASWFAISLPRVAGIARPQLRALAFPSDHRLSLANNADRKVPGRRSDKTSHPFGKRGSDVAARVGLSLRACDVLAAPPDAPQPVNTGEIHQFLSDLPE